MPKRMVGLQCIVDERRPSLILLIGAWDDSNCYVYDMDANDYRPITSLPITPHFHSAVLNGNHIVSFGGDPNHLCSMDITSDDSSKWRWIQNKECKMNLGQFSRCVKKSDQIYIVGGDESDNEVWILSQNNETTQHRSRFPIDSSPLYSYLNLQSHTHRFENENRPLRSRHCLL